MDDTLKVMRQLAEALDLPPPPAELSPVQLKALSDAYAAVLEMEETIHRIKESLYAPSYS